MIKPILARQDDGGVQITFTIPFADINKAQEETIDEMVQDVEVPGYRKGKAPRDIAKGKIPQATLIEHSLSHILPKALAEAIKENGLKLAMYPKYELLKSDEGKDWEIIARTCELPEVVLGDCKKLISGEIRSASLKKELTREEKEQVAIKTILTSVKIVIPKILIDEEVNSRLSSLLERIEKLGLALESYLTSIGKNPDTIRGEYEIQAREAISLDLILTKIADTENLKVDEKELADTLKTVSDSDIESQKRIVEAVLIKRKALEFLTSLS
jgi:trigger factor